MTDDTWGDDDLDDELDALDPEVLSTFAKVAISILQNDTGAKYAQYHDDPYGFFRDVLGVEPWESEDPTQHGQADLIRAVGECDLVACKSGHKIGKSLTAVGLALWWVATRKNARVQLTAPTFHQIKNILWRELRNIDRATDIARKLGTVVPLDPSTGMQLPDGNEIVGISTKKQENMAGVSGANLLFIVDEASGYEDELWEVIESGNSAGGAKIFVISNPSRTAGWFFQLFRKRQKGWRLFTISSENTPNVRAREKLVPGLATYEFGERMREKIGPGYAKDSVYMVRILGEFPLQATDAVISLELVERATKRWRPTPTDVGELVLGVDVARFGGDANVIQPVRGLYAYEAVEVAPTVSDTGELAEMDGPFVAQQVIEVAAEHRINFERVRVNVDGIGVGSSVVDALKHSTACSDGWLIVVDMNVGEVPDDDVAKDYPRLRDQLWFGARDWLKDGGVFKHDDALEEELLGATYTFDLRNKMKVMGKDIMREVLSRSPDRADALCLGVYRGSRGRRYEFEYVAAYDPRHPGEAPKWGEDQDADRSPRGKGAGYF